MRDRADREQVRDPFVAGVDDVALDLGLTQLLERTVLDWAPPLPGEHAWQARHTPALERLVDHTLGLVTELRELDRDVPEDYERSARTKHAGDLGDRLLTGEPVERLGREDRVDASVRERDRFAAAAERLATRNDLIEYGTHRVVRLHGHHAREPRHERPGQLAGARAEVEHLPIRLEHELVDHLVEQLLGPARPPELVLARRAPERVGRSFPSQRR
jgi:hypothetical protein